MEEKEYRENIAQELRRIDGIKWMHNVVCNSDITIDMHDVINRRHFMYFSLQRDGIFFYGQSMRYPGGDKWRFEDLETSILEWMLRRLQYIELRGYRLPAETRIIYGR